MTVTILESLKDCKYKRVKKFDLALITIREISTLRTWQLVKWKRLSGIFLLKRDIIPFAILPFFFLIFTLIFIRCWPRIYIFLLYVHFYYCCQLYFLRRPWDKILHWKGGDYKLLYQKDRNKPLINKQTPKWMFRAV